MGFSGSLPTGARYDLGGNMNRLSGQNSVGVNFNPAFQYTPDVNVTVTQPLLKDFWIDAGRLQIKLVKKDIKMSDLDLETIIQTVVHDVTQFYYDLLAAREQVKVREAAVQLKEQFLSETKKRVQAGTLAPLDEKQAESDAATARADLIAARYVAEKAELDLKALLTDKYAAMHSTTLEPSEKLIAVAQLFNVVESWRTGLEKRPDYLRKKEFLESQNIRLKYTYNQLFPLLDVVGTYGRNGLGATLSDSLETIGQNKFEKWGGAVVFTVPLTRTYERSAHKIQKVNVQSAVLDLKLTEEGVVRDIDDAIKKIRSAYAAIDSTREARVFAEAALDAEQKKLENGKSTNFQVLQLQDKLTQARAAEISALTAYNKALYDLYFREGSILERQKIVLQIK